MATRRVSSGTELVVATHNPGKLREIRALLEPFGVIARSAGELGLEEPEETGVTFIENARIKALATMTASGLPALADDSGLAVAALNGDPGIHSARWAGPDKDFAFAMGQVESRLNETSEKNRNAAFICALTLCWPDGEMTDFEGRVEGNLVWPPRGDKGFGYDPVFIPEGFSETFGEMDQEQKHAMSHRADAFRKLVDACFSKS